MFFNSGSEGLASTGALGGMNALGKTVLIPDMNRIACRLFAGVFRSFGIDAEVLETCRGGDLGKQYTSGKECYPCQVTMGDILYFIKKKTEEKHSFNPEKYIYFMPEAGGPCRFGMYSKYQRMVLDSFQGMEKLKIVSLSTKDNYSLAGVLEKGKRTAFRKAGYFSIMIADILDRLTWRIRPYEKACGMTEEFITGATAGLAAAFEEYGARGGFEEILLRLCEIVKRGKEIMDPAIPRKPLVGMVGEIFLRMHPQSNQNLILMLEEYGAEVVNASFGEWMNFVAFTNHCDMLTENRFDFSAGKLISLIKRLKKTVDTYATLKYQEHVHRSVFSRVGEILELFEDHTMAHLKKILEEKDLYSFQLGTETTVSLAAILAYIRQGCSGVVNVYPLACMPGLATTAVIKPVMNAHGIPYLDAPCDGTLQPGREAVIRTFMYQAEQHFQRKENAAGTVGARHAPGGGQPMPEYAGS